MFKVKKIHEKAILPTKSNSLDAGYDFYALGDVFLQPRSQSIIDTGIELVQLPTPNMGGYWETVLLIWPRSGLDAKFAVTTGAGVIDTTYRGQILILLKNESYDRVTIPYGKAIAQALIQPVWVGGMEVVDYSGESERGGKGGIAEARGGSLGFAYRDRTEV